MGVQATVVFTDLHGSTAVFEALGNARATETITNITTWIAEQCTLANGRVVKTLGDGVLALFPDGASAIRAVVELQRVHFKRMTRLHKDTAMPIRIGLASGDVELVSAIATEMRSTSRHGCVICAAPTRFGPMPHHCMKCPRHKALPSGFWAPSTSVAVPNPARSTRSNGVRKRSLTF